MKDCNFMIVDKEKDCLNNAVGLSCSRGNGGNILLDILYMYTGCL